MNTPHTNTGGGGGGGGGMVRLVDCVLFSPKPATALVHDPRDRVALAGVVAGVREIFDQLRLMLTPTAVVWLDMDEPATTPGADVTGLAWRTALAVQADGWLLRNAITYTTTPHPTTPTPIPIPIPIQGRGQGRVPPARPRTMFLLTRGPRYYFALPTPHTTTTTDTTATAVRWPTPCRAADSGRPARATHPPRPRAASPTRHTRSTAAGCAGVGGRGQVINPGDVWRLAPDPYCYGGCSCVPARRAGLRGGAASITAAARAITLGCPPGGVVHDPLAVCGHGPVAYAAGQLARHFHPATPHQHLTTAGDPVGHPPRYGGPGVHPRRRPEAGAAARHERPDGMNR